KSGYSFSPPNKSYSNVTSDDSNENYTGTITTSDPNEDPNNNTRPTATPITFTGSGTLSWHSGNSTDIHLSNDQDWYQFDAFAGDVITANCDVTSQLDAEIVLYWGSQNVRRVNDANNGGAETLSYTVPENKEGRYYVGVGYYSSISKSAPAAANTGAYQLHIQRETSLLYVPANGNRVYSSTLTNGTDYRITAMGVYHYWYPETQFMADAEYAEWDQAGNWRQPSAGESVLELFINNDAVNWAGQYNSDHIYTTELRGNGQHLSFKIFDNDHQDNRGGLNVKVEAMSGESRTQTISMQKNWNIISFQVMPDEADIEQVFEPIKHQIKKIMDQKANFAIVNNNNEWLDFINDINLQYGYLIKVKNNTILQVEGQPRALPMTVPLTKGWNIIGYPYYTSNSSNVILGALMDSRQLIKIQSESAEFIVRTHDGYYQSGGFLFQPGKGYEIKVSENCNLVCDDESTMSKLASVAIKAYVKSILPDGVYLSSQRPMNIICNFDTDLSEQATIKLTNQDGFGFEYSINNADESIGLVACTDDSGTEFCEGFRDGDEIFITIIDEKHAHYHICCYSDGQTNTGTSFKFEPRGTAYCEIRQDQSAQPLKTKATGSLVVYPNPFQDQTNIIVYTKDYQQVEVTVYNMLGKSIKNIYCGEVPDGRHCYLWDGCDNNGEGVSSGIYLIVIQIGSENYAEKLMYLH
ncbi:T9SS type A sorting domain-containing protein, partial [bacterium]|nr:T9SS type A sorting domain-containing protein [bacterium]